MALLHVSPDPHLLIFLCLIKLQVNLSEHVFFFQPQGPLSLLECLLVNLATLLEFSKLLILSLELFFNVGLFYESCVHVLLYKELEGRFLLNKLL